MTCGFALLLRQRSIRYSLCGPPPLAGSLPAGLLLPCHSSTFDWTLSGGQPRTGFLPLRTLTQM